MSEEENVTFKVHIVGVLRAEVCLEVPKCPGPQTDSSLKDNQAEILFPIDHPATTLQWYDLDFIGLSKISQGEHLTRNVDTECCFFDPFPFGFHPLLRTLLWWPRALISLLRST